MMFFKISTFLSALESCQPEAFALYEKIVLELEAGNHPLAVKAFEELPNISIDYAVMEKAPKVQMIPADFPWDDVGSWDALERSIEPDANGNITQGVVATIDSANCIVINDDPSARVGILGLNNLLIVNTPHAMFVCPKTEAQRVKEISTAANLLSIE